MPHAQVALGVQHAPLGEPPGLDEQIAGRVAVGPADQLGDLRHLLAGFEVRLAGHVLQMPAVQRYELAGGVEHVRHRAVRRVEIADGVAQHRGDPRLFGQSEQAGRPVGLPLALVIDDLDDHLVDAFPPRREPGGGEVGPPGGDRLPDVGGGAEQHDETGGVLGDQLRGGDQAAVRPPPARRRPRAPSPIAGRRPWPGQMRRGHQPAQGRPAAPAYGQHHHPPAAGKPEVDAENRTNVIFLTGHEVLDGSVQAIAIGQRERFHAELGGLPDECLRPRDAVPERVSGRGPQVDEGVHTLSVPGTREHPCTGGRVEAQLVYPDLVIRGGLDPPELPLGRRLGLGMLFSPPVTSGDPMFEDPPHRIEPAPPHEPDRAALDRPHINGVAIDATHKPLPCLSPWNRQGEGRRCLQLEHTFAIKISQVASEGDQPVSRPSATGLERRARARPAPPAGPTRCGWCRGFVSAFRHVLICVLPAFGHRPFSGTEKSLDLVNRAIKEETLRTHRHIVLRRS